MNQTLFKKNFPILLTFSISATVVLAVFSILSGLDYETIKNHEEDTNILDNFLYHGGILFNDKSNALTCSIVTGVSAFIFLLVVFYLIYHEEKLK